MGRAADDPGDGPGRPGASVVPVGTSGIYTLTVTAPPETADRRRMRKGGLCMQTRVFQPSKRLSFPPLEQSASGQKAAQRSGVRWRRSRPSLSRGSLHVSETGRIYAVLWREVSPAAGLPARSVSEHPQLAAGRVPPPAGRSSRWTPGGLTSWGSPSEVKAGRTLRLQTSEGLKD